MGYWLFRAKTLLDAKRKYRLEDYLEQASIKLKINTTSLFQINPFENVACNVPTNFQAFVY